MITCSECIKSLFPEDPRILSGRYHHNTCDYFCDKPLYFRELEEIREPLQQEAWVGRQWDKVQQLRSEVEGWREKHAEMMLELDKLQKKRQKPKPKYS